MRRISYALLLAVGLACCWGISGPALSQQQKPPAKTYNTAKQKLREGKQIFGATVLSPDPNIYCALAN
jgi:hypothetical protein